MNKLNFCFILWGLLVISACSKEKISEDTMDLSSYCGNFVIEEIYWTGETIDFNGDGSFSHNLLKELGTFPGFVSSWITAEVEMSNDNNQILNISSVIPVYTTRMIAGNALDEIIYHNVKIQVRWHSEWGFPGFSKTEFQPQSVDGLHGLENVYISKLSEQSFELHAKCSLYDKANNRFVEDTAIYTFRKSE